MRTTALRHLAYSTALVIFSLTLTACGGSSGGPGPASSSAAQSSSDATSSDSSAESSASASSADTEPDEFGFDDQTGVQRDSQVESGAVTVQGIDEPVPISIDGGHYKLDEGEFTDQPDTVEAGQDVTLRLTSAEGFEEPRTATLTVGGVTGTFTVTTEARDTTPDEFDFPNLEDQEPNTEVTSEPVTIAGINDPAEITVENGQYAIDDGEFTDQAGQIGNEQSVTVKATTPASADDHTTVTVTIGGVDGEFTVSTPPDTEPPEAAFVFPTPMTATEGDTVIVRGTASDELSSVRSVTLTVTNEDGSSNSYDVETDDGFAAWQKQVNLGSGENTITVLAEDEHDNAITDGASVTVVKQEFAEAFPDDEVAIQSPQSLIIDEERGRILVTDFEGRIVAVDMASGSRSVFLQLDEGNEVNSRRTSGLVLDKPRNRLLVNGATDNGDGILGVDLDTKKLTIINTETVPSEDQPALYTPRGMAVHPSDPDQVYVLASGTSNLARLDLTTGLRTLASSNDMPDSGPGFSFPTHLLIDNAKSRALVAQDSSDGILSVDLSTGVREVFLAEGVPEGTPRVLVRTLVSDNPEKELLAFEGYARALWSVDAKTREITVISGTGVPNNNNPLGRFIDMALAPNGEYIVGVDLDVNAVYAIDVITGERLVVSKPTAEFPF